MKDAALHEWAEAIAREYPVSASQIVAMHHELGLSGMKSWQIPWLIQELAQGKSIGIVSLETLPRIFSQERHEWYDDLATYSARCRRNPIKAHHVIERERRERWLEELLEPRTCEPIKLRRRTIDVPEVAALLLPRGPRRNFWIPLRDPLNPIHREIVALRKRLEVSCPPY